MVAMIQYFKSLHVHVHLTINGELVSITCTYGCLELYMPTGNNNYLT